MIGARFRDAVYAPLLRMAGAGAWQAHSTPGRWASVTLPTERLCQSRSIGIFGNGIVIVTDHRDRLRRTGCIMW
jgi:hypothetical protein